MQLVLYMYQALCKPSVFEINGRQADYEDLVFKEILILIQKILMDVVI